MLDNFKISLGITLMFSGIGLIVIGSLSSTKPTPSVKDIILEINTDKVQQALASSTREQIITVCNKYGFIDASKITNE